jgi:hypothetical protein
MSGSWKLKTDCIGTNQELNSCGNMVSSISFTLASCELTICCRFAGALQTNIVGTAFASYVPIYRFVTRQGETKQKKAYKVGYRTGQLPGASSNAPVYIQLHGENGSTAFLLLVGYVLCSEQLYYIGLRLDIDMHISICTFNAQFSCIGNQF